MDTQKLPFSLPTCCDDDPMPASSEPVLKMTAEPPESEGGTPMPSPMPEPMPTPMPEPMPENGRLPADSIDPALLALAMGFVPRQAWEVPYEYDVALKRGTIFPSLDKPFLGEEAVRR